MVGYRNEDGSANLCGYSLPADRAAAACANIDELAKKVKQAGDRRAIDLVRADLYLGMLDGSYAGWAETDIVAHMTAAALCTDPVDDDPSPRQAPCPPQADGKGDRPYDGLGSRHLGHTQQANRRFGRTTRPPSAAVANGTSSRPADISQVNHPRLGDDAASRHPGDTQQRGGPIDQARRPSSAADAADADSSSADTSEGRSQARHSHRDVSKPLSNRPDAERTANSDCGGDLDDSRWSAEGQVLGGPWPPRRPSGPSARWAGVEIRAEITTLVGWDDHPAEIAGWGHVHADLARQLVHDQTEAEWRYALTDDDGRLLYEGITRHRPAGYPARGDAPARGGIVELHIPLSTLHRMATEPARLDGWARLIADLVRQADLHERKQQDTSDQIVRPEAGRGGRSPGRVLRRHTQIRDRTCTHPGCRQPASGTDGDHTRDWADGGATRDENIGSLCRHHHRLKHVGGWRVSQPEPGHFVWTSRLGMHYHVRPPLIIQPLPDSIRRDPPLVHHAAQRYAPDPDEPDHPPIWREPPAPKAPPQPPPSPSFVDELPPNQC